MAVQSKISTNCINHRQTQDRNETSRKATRDGAAAAGEILPAAATPARYLGTRSQQPPLPDPPVPVAAPGWSVFSPIMPSTMRTENFDYRCPYVTKVPNAGITIHIIYTF